ncbi:helix-turn-helix transcriptional regulator [Streptomyces avicenniae]|uniref:helix-turn-helix transcriptional regulator n=1 Tax=Streptomyces avicenniae TaxID=500153 RepID=UPI00069ABADF|nr:AraC family transcriptional regulator [Streptomyces avicenniae]
MPGAVSEITAWRPALPGVAEVLHARMTGHVYPMHTHDTWTLLVVDAGAVRYDLSRHEHGALGRGVTLLPPHVPHNGQAATPRGFRKRVLYLEPTELGEELIGPSVDRPVLRDPAARRLTDRLHAVLSAPGHDRLEAESLLALVGERLRGHLGAPPVAAPPPTRDAGLAGALRDLLDGRVAEGVTLREAATLLHAHPTSLVRAFGREFGMPPHRYLTARRVDLARRLLLDGTGPAEAAVTAGFHDQPHLTRHFRRLLGTTPGRYADSGRLYAS